MKNSNVLKISKKFFLKDTETIARDLLRKVLVRKINSKVLRARIVETEAYLGEEDPASYASKGDNKVSKMMKEQGGKILIYNVHKYKMLNFVTAEKGKPRAVLIRALEPLNFKRRCCGPGLLTLALDIDDRFHGQDILKNKEIWLEEQDIDKTKEKEIVKAFRIGVRQDLPKKLRFYIKGNEHVSRI